MSVRAGVSSRSILTAAVLFAGGALTGHVIAGASGPGEHKGLDVETLGVVPPDSMAAQVGLGERTLLLRRITIEPGGQIARHDHATVPGVVHVASGTWIEGTPSGEREFSAGETFAEVEDTAHWFYNRGDEPAAAYVCDIKPAG
jgi:quercetin dioxygenase-like cupin family protein